MDSKPPPNSDAIRKAVKLITEATTFLAIASALEDIIAAGMFDPKVFRLTMLSEAEQRMDKAQRLTGMSDEQMRLVMVDEMGSA